MRGIPIADGALSAKAKGVNTLVDRVVVLTGVHVHYKIGLPAGVARDKVDRALASHVDKCPTARSLKGSVKVTWTAEVAEA